MKPYDRNTIVKCPKCGQHYTTSRQSVCWYCR